MSFDQEPDPLSDALEHCQRLVKERDRLKAEVVRLRSLLAQSTNYTADDDTNAKRFDFANGRVVVVRPDGFLNTWITPLPAPPGREEKS